MSDEELKKKGTTRENIVSILMTCEDMDFLRSTEYNPNPNGVPLWQLVKKGWLQSVKEAFIKMTSPEKYEEELLKSGLNSTQLKQLETERVKKALLEREEKTRLKRLALENKSLIEEKHRLEENIKAGLWCGDVLKEKQARLDEINEELNKSSKSLYN